MPRKTAVDPSSAAKELATAYECLKNADLANADIFLERAIRFDFENPEVLFSMKCLQFWKEQLTRMPETTDLVGRGDYLCTSWKSFLGFLSHIQGDYEIARYAFRRLAFGMALDQYLAIPDEQKEAMGPAIDFRLGRARKACGDIETAIVHLERAIQNRKNDASTLAELADAYALAGEIRKSKALFREAFFLDPQAVELEFLESEFIIKIIENVRELGYSGNDIAEWIPVYGELWGVLNIKRALTSTEYARIASSARQMDVDLRERPQLRASILPRLLNRYFWMADYLHAQNDAAGLNSILSKIKILDPSIYGQYTGS